jgi:hypothetical protein
MNTLAPDEETMMGILAREVRDGDWAACGRCRGWPASIPASPWTEVWQLTDFEFRAPAHILETLFLTTEEGRLLYGPLQEKLARVYPQFAARLHMT